MEKGTSWDRLRKKNIIGQEIKVEKSEQGEVLRDSFLLSFPWSPRHTPLTEKWWEGTSKPKLNYFPLLDHLSWWVWRQHEGQNTGPSKHEVVPLGNRCAERSQRNSVCSQNQEASGTSGYLPTFLSSCSRKKSFPRPFGLHQNLKIFLRHEALSGDKITTSASQMPGSSTVPCLYSHSFLCKVFLAKETIHPSKPRPKATFSVKYTRFLQAKWGHSFRCLPRVLHSHLISLF